MQEDDHGNNLRMFGPHLVAGHMILLRSDYWREVATRYKRNFFHSLAASAPPDAMRIWRSCSSIVRSERSLRYDILGRIGRREGRLTIGCGRIDPLRVDLPLERLGIGALHLHITLPAFGIDSTPRSEIE